MSFIKVYVHFVWSTKNRYPFLDSKALRLKVWNHIFENGVAKGIYIDSVGGYSDHCHCLVSMCANQTIQDIAKMIKGESSWWINKNELTNEHFRWQDEYYAAAVCESRLPQVRKYIMNQERYHSKSPFEIDNDDFLNKYGLSNK